MRSSPRRSKDRETAYGRAFELADAIIRYGDARGGRPSTRGDPSADAGGYPSRRAPHPRRQPPRRDPLRVRRAIVQAGRPARASRCRPRSSALACRSRRRTSRPARAPKASVARRRLTPSRRAFRKPRGTLSNGLPRLSSAPNCAAADQRRSASPPAAAADPRSQRRPRRR